LLPLIPDLQQKAGGAELLRSMAEDRGNAARNIVTASTRFEMAEEGEEITRSSL